MNINTRVDDIKYDTTMNDLTFEASIGDGKSSIMTTRKNTDNFILQLKSHFDQ